MHPCPVHIPAKGNLSLNRRRSEQKRPLLVATLCGTNMLESKENRGTESEFPLINQLIFHQLICLFAQSNYADLHYCFIDFKCFIDLKVTEIPIDNSA